MNQNVNLDDVRTEIEDEIRYLSVSELEESDYLRPSRLFDRSMRPSEIFELWDKLGIQRTMENYMGLIQQAMELKRQGDLDGANRIYINLFRNQTKRDKEFIWPWCKVMILAKNFADLDTLIRYLHTYNVRQNLVEEKAGGRFERYRRYGNLPEKEFEFNASLYLREVCESALASKNEVEWRFKQYGGSAYWAEYQLSDDEYLEFINYFSLGKAGITERTEDSSAQLQIDTKDEVPPAPNPQSFINSPYYVGVDWRERYETPERYRLENESGDSGENEVVSNSKPNQLPLHSNTDAPFRTVLALPLLVILFLIVVAILQILS